MKQHLEEMDNLYSIFLLDTTSKASEKILHDMTNKLLLHRNECLVLCMLCLLDEIAMVHGADLMWYHIPYSHSQILGFCPFFIPSE